MKKILFAGAALVALTVAGAASAADLPSRRQAPPAYIPPVFTWTGFYAGVNLGGAFSGDNNLKDLNINGVYEPSFTSSSRTNSDSSSFTGGAQVGYNYQMGSVVLGAETDFNYVHLSRRKTFDDSVFAVANGINDTLTGRSEVNWYGTLRARLGFTPVDRVLVYATGGLAYGEVKTSVGYADSTGYVIAGNKSDTRVGWTIGAGVEYAVTNNITVRGEYAYVDLGDKTIRAYDGFGNFASAKSQVDFHVVRAGLNYKF